MATRVEADLLIPGSGDPISNGCVVFDGPKITYAGPVENTPVTSSSDNKPKPRCSPVTSFAVARAASVNISSATRCVPVAQTASGATTGLLVKSVE